MMQMTCIARIETCISGATIAGGPKVTIISAHNSVSGMSTGFIMTSHHHPHVGQL